MFVLISRQYQPTGRVPVVASIDATARLIASRSCSLLISKWLLHR